MSTGFPEKANAVVGSLESPYYGFILKEIYMPKYSSSAIMG